LLESDKSIFKAKVEKGMDKAKFDYLLQLFNYIHT